MSTAGSPQRVYTCPVCSREILAVEQWDLADPTRTTVTTQLGHDGPMDAACRWAFEALHDELQEQMNRSLRHAKEHMDRMIRDD